MNLYRHRPHLAAAAIGALVFFIVAPVEILLPWNLDWALRHPDPAQHLLGWLFFQHEDWAWPLGSIPKFAAPLPSTIALTDSIPLVAIMAKAFFGWVQSPWQYQGIWLLSCFVLQAVVARAWLASAGVSSVSALVGSVVFCMSPALLLRYHHEALCAQWTLLVALWLTSGYFPAPEKKPWLWVMLLAATSWIHPYLTFMVGVFFIVDIFSPQRALQEKVTNRLKLISLSLTATITAVSWWAQGYFELGPVPAFGFGFYSADLTALFNPLGYSQWLDGFKIRQPQREGVAFVGFTLLFVLFFASIRQVWRSGLKTHRYNPWLTVACLAAFVFSLSHVITFSGRTVYDSELLSWLYTPAKNILRASGRFVWPMHYLLLWGSLVLLARACTNRVYGTGIFTFIIAVQLVEHSALIDYSRRYFEPIQNVSRFQQTDLESLFQQSDRVVMIPPYFGYTQCLPQWYSELDYVSLAYIAAKHSKSFYSGYLARYPQDSVKSYCASVAKLIEMQAWDSNTLYLVHDAYQPVIDDSSALKCQRVEKFHACVRRERIATSK